MLIKDLCQVFTNKILFVEWILAMNVAIGRKLTKLKAKLEVNEYVENHDDIDMSTAPPAVRNNRLYDEDILKMRWDLCSSCEFLTDDLRCQKCGCPMMSKHKIAYARCPIGKWEKYDINHTKPFHNLQAVPK